MIFYRYYSQPVFHYQYYYFDRELRTMRMYYTDDFVYRIIRRDSYEQYGINQLENKLRVWL